MTALALLIAASLIFTAGWSIGAAISRRNAYEDGYLACQIQMADDAAITETLRPEAQRHAARMGWQ